MRYAAAFASLCFLAACEAGPAEPLDAAKYVGESASTPTSYTFKIVMRGRGEIKHAADLSGATSCSTLPPNPESLDCIRTFAAGAVVTFQPTAGPGYAFDHWSGACGSKGTGACTVTMNENRVVEAIFKAPVVAPSSFTLKIFVRGRGEVKHTADAAGAASCSTLAPNPENADCVRTFAPNTVVTLQATAGTGYTFDHWGGPCSGTGTCTITMNESRSLEAIFKAPVVAPTSYTLKILVRGRGEVKHTADATGATTCSTLAPNPENADCVRTFAAGAEIVLQPVAAAGLKFYGWGGACASSGTGTCTLKANESRTLEVKFGT
jgi:hypothetical protein